MDYDIQDPQDLRAIKEMLRLVGPWEAEVVSNTDPDERGMISVKIPELFGEEAVDECLPKFPRDEMSIPKPGQFVWIEFQYLDRQSPLWYGSWYPDDQIYPNMNGKPDRHVIKEVVDGDGQDLLTIRFDEGQELYIKDHVHGSRIQLNVQTGEIDIYSDESPEGQGQAAVNINGKKADFTGDPAARLGDETTHVCVVYGTLVKGQITQGCPSVILNNKRR